MKKMGENVGKQSILTCEKQGFLKRSIKLRNKKEMELLYLYSGEFETNF